MGFSLRNLLDEAVAQVNPFDHGQTAHSVAQQHPVFTRPMQAPQPVNNGGGLQVVNQPQNEPTLTVAPPPTFHLNPVTVAAPQQLHVGNTVIAPTPGATAGVPDPSANQPSLADHLKSILSNDVVHPVVDTGKSLYHTGKYVVDSGALGLAEMSHDPTTIQLAKDNQNQDFSNSLAPMVGRTGNMLAESNPVSRALGITPMDLQSKQIDKQTQDLLNQGATKEQAQAYNDAAKQNLYESTLHRAGFTDTTSQKDMYLKALGDIGGTASMFIAPTAGAEAVAGETAGRAALAGNVAKTAAMQGALGGGATAASVAGSGASGADTAKAFMQGFAQNALLTAAGAGVKAGTPAIISMAKDAVDNAHPLGEAGSVPIPKIISNAADAVKQTTHDIVTGKPNRNVSDAELASAQKVRNSMQGYGSSMDLTEQDMANYRNIQKKIGADVNDHTAVDDVLGARRTYQTRQDYMNSPEVKQGGYAKVPGKGTPAEEPVVPEPAQNSVDSSANSTPPEGSYAWLKQQEAEAAAKKAGQPTVDQAQAAADNVKQQATAGQKPATGVVDKQLNQIEKARQSVIDTAAQELRDQQKPVRNLKQEVLQHGGISSTDYETYPKGIIRKSGMSADKMAQELKFASEDDLMQALNDQKTAKPLSMASARTIAAQQLENGKHPYAADYKEITDALAKRQDELSQYPNGKYRQVKVTDKPNQMSDAELASLAGTPEAKAKPAGNKIVQPAANKELRNADAERQALEDLQKRGTETALENYQQSTGVTLQKAVKDINRVAKEAGVHTDLGKNPLEGRVLLPKVQEGDWKQATLNSRFVQSKELEVGQKALNSYHALAPKDQVLLKKIEQGTVRKVAAKASDPAAFKQAVKDIRNYYDTRHAYDRTLGIDVGYRTNYLRQLFDRVEEKPTVDGETVAPTGDEQLHGTGGNKNPGYTKERSFDTLGTEVGKALEKDIAGSSFNHGQLSYEKGLNEAFPGKIANGERPRSANDGRYEYLNHPFGKDLSAPKDIAHEINSRTWHQTDSKTLDTYDKLNHGFKYLKLSGGLFHAFTESGNFIGHQLASGKLFKDPAATGQMAKVFFSPKAMHSELTRMADEGTLDKAHLAGLTTQAKQILADVNVSALDKGASKAAKYTGIQAMHDATFQREIPYAKLKIFEQRTAGLDPSKPADLAKMRTQAATINNLFGGINREVEGIKPGTFKWLQRGLLATDFTEGKIHTLYNALTAKGETGTIARQAVAGKALLFGLIATAGAAAGGDYQGKSAKQVATDAAGNLVDPSFEMGGYHVGLPKTHISEVVGALKPTSTSTGKAWNGSGLLTYAKDRTAALPSEAIQLLSNKNYYDQPLYGTNTKKNGGGKISGTQAASNVAQTVLPIPVGQAATTASGKQAPAAAVANVIGFKAKPNKANQVAFQGVDTTLNDKQTGAYTNQVNSTLKSMQQQLTSSNAYKNANPNDQAKMMTDLKKNVTSAVNRDFASKNNLGQFAPDYTGNGSQATTKEQDILSGKINPDAYTPGAKNTDSYKVAQFKNSGDRLTTIGNQTYYKTSDGSVKHQNTYTYNTGIQTAKLDYSLNRAKSGGDYSTWKTTAEQKFKLLHDQMNHLDPQTEQEAILKLQTQADDLANQYQKYNDYGGSFTKPKSARSSLSAIKNSYTPFTYGSGISFKDNNDKLRSLLDNAHLASVSGGGKAKQVVKV